MKKKHSSASLSDVALRVLADFVVVQVAMLAAFVLALQLRDPPDQSVTTLLAAARAYYLRLFLPLSALFPVAYGLGGLYTRCRNYDISAKLRRAVAWATACVLTVVTASFLLSNADRLPRTAAVIFAVLVIIATPAIRGLKHWAFEKETGRTGPFRLGKKTVLVVGGAGYIGSILVRKLLARGYRVRVLDSLVYGDSAIAALEGHSHFEFLRGDCRNIRDVVCAMTDVEAVVHLAAIVGDPACDCDHKTAREINYAATRMMIEIAKGKRVGRFVFASSCSVYGASEQVMDENSEVSPISLYAETKVDSETALLSAATGDFHPTILRFSTIFGLSPRPRFDLVVNLLAAKALQEKLVTIYNGEQWRPFLHVADAAEAVIRVLEAPVEIVGGQIYNVGDDRLNYTLTGVARKILEVFPGTTIEQIANSDRRSYRVSFDKIRAHIGFSCSTMLEEGVRELKAAFEQGLISDYRSPLYSNVKFLQKYGCPLQEDEIGARVMAALAQKTYRQAPAA
jgi:nucleoside-diphosphate-sugar epimerase